MPEALTTLLIKVERIEKSLTIAVDEDKHDWMNLDELLAYLPQKPAKPTVYGWVGNRSIPFHKHESKKALMFLKSEIDIWLMSGRHQTQVEVTASAHTLLK